MTRCREDVVIMTTLAVLAELNRDTTIYLAKIYRTTVHRNDSLSKRQFIEPAVCHTDTLSNWQFIERQIIETTVYRN